MSTIITFAKAVTINGEEVAHIEMREPTVRDQLVASKMKGSDAEKEITMIANLCDLSPDQLHSLPLREYRKVQQTFMDFLD